jgi:hypothetical protein
MGAVARLSGALLVLAACSAREDVEVPAFAADLPGRTALVLWNRGAPPPAELVEALAELAGWLDMPRANAGEDVLAWAAPERVPVGWQTLAEARPFRDALASLDPAAQHVLYADIQQLVAAIPRREEAAFEVLRGQALRALALEGCRSVVLGVRPLRRGYEVAGTLLTTGLTAGLPGMLTSVLPAPHVGARPDAAARLHVEAQFDPEIARAMLRELANLRAERVPGALNAMLDMFVGGFVNRALPHLGSWLSLRVHDKGFELAVGIVDREGLEDLEEQWLERLGRLLPGGLPTKRRYTLEADCARSVAGDPLPPLTPFEASRAAAARIEAAMPDGGRASLSVRRLSATAVRIEGRLAR